MKKVKQEREVAVYNVPADVMEVINHLIAEEERQENDIELIASENFVSEGVLHALGSVLTNKYAEGYPGKRYYDGCSNVDAIEIIAQEQLKKLFGVKYANVQPHSGSQANAAAYLAIRPTGTGKILGMSLDAGGHLTHGYKLSFSGIQYDCASYGLDENGYISYEDVRRKALEFKPDIIVAGASAYSRAIDFAKFREIADEVGAFLVADIAHIAGLVAAGLHQSPAGYADIVTSTTHKTLRGPRGGVIMTNNPSLAKAIDRAVFPGLQGGPLMNVIAAKAVAFTEALRPDFIEYQKQVIKNADAMARRFIELGYSVVSGGTDNHLFLVDIYSTTGMSGKDAAKLLSDAGITCNKNSIPNDILPPTKSSGIRIGTPAITTRGFKEAECIEVVNIIDELLKIGDVSGDIFHPRHVDLMNVLLRRAKLVKKMEGLVRAE